MQPFDGNILIENIKVLLKSHNMSQTKLAEEIHVGQPTVNKYLTGKQPISVEHLYNIAQVFGVSLDSLFIKADDKVKSSDGNNQGSLSYPDRLRASLCALATIFKYSALRTTDINFQETVYAEATDEYGRDTGTYYKAHVKGPLGDEDPTNTYVGIFYSNYSSIAYSFDSQDDEDEYFSELQYTGNVHDYNVKINKFIKKLAALHKVYIEDNMDTESYYLAIDNNLAEALEQVK